MSNSQDFVFGTSDPKNLFKNILQHEREFRGVNWLEDFFDEKGHKKLGFVEEVLEKTHRKIAEIRPFAIENFKAYAPDDAKLLDLIGFDKNAYESISKLKGDALKIYLLELLHNLQTVEKELNTSFINWELVGKTFTIVGVVCTCVKTIPVINAGMATGMTYYAALAGALGTAWAIAALSAIVVVLVSFVILMLKEAREYHLVLNNTDYDLRTYEIYRHHGKIDFLPADEYRNFQINSRMLDGKKPTIFGGLFGIKKKDGALYGAEGVIQLDMYKNNIKHQTCTFLAYDIPLTNTWISGGDNSCFVKCSVGNPSAKEFFEKNEKNIEKGNTESSDTLGNIKITKKINSKSGSEVFAVTCYQQI